MTLKRLVLIALTLIVVLLVGSSLIGSLSKPQITNRLELYQTNLLLSATGLADGQSQTDLQVQLRTAVLGDDPLKTALEQYQKVRDTAQEDLDSFQAGLPQSAVPSATVRQPIAELLTLIAQQQHLLAQLDLQIGLLQVQQGGIATAQQTWTDLQQRLHGEISQADQAIAQTAQVLQDLWGQPPIVPGEAVSSLNASLDGWFRAVSLHRVYELQGNAPALTALAAEQAAIAQSTLVKLLILGAIPGGAAITGIGLMIFLVIQRLTQGSEQALLSLKLDAWEVPWDWETIWQVLIVGFFFMGQVVVPLLLSLLHLASMGAGSTRVRAIYTLVYYITMASATLLVLFFSIRQYRPLPTGWFRYQFQRNWPVWGIGGYLAALPLMLGVSLLNQQVWQGQGGSNPLLQIVLEENDPVALGLFLFTAAVAAPIFEETLFRGFLLPSLTRYLPMGGAIALSSLIFACAHLSLSEVLPLTVLGGVLGFVYGRSRNLLAPILLHSLWNSITMLGLFVLGSGVD